MFARQPKAPSTNLVVGRSKLLGEIILFKLQGQEVVLRASSPVTLL